MRKRSILLSLTLFTMVIALCGCGCKHVWKAATCAEPQTCTLCGATEGEVTEHTWKEATCTEPKTCEVCGETDGSALGHNFTEATCSQPKTCDVCGETEGESLPHDFMEATFVNPKTCKVCGKTEGGKYILEEAFDVEESYAKHSRGVATPKGFLEFNYSSPKIVFGMYDYSDNSKLWETPIPSLGYGITSAFISPQEEELFVIYTDWSGYESDDTFMIIKAIDYDGNIIETKKIPIYSLYGVLNDLEASGYCYAGEKYGVVYNRPKNTVTAVFDKQQNKFVDNSVVDISKLKGYSYWDYNIHSEKYLAHEVSSDKWGYVDEDGNMIKKYDDTSGFIKEGYAFIIEGGFVSLIDKDYNVLLENIAEADGVSTASDYLLCYRKGDERHYFRIGYDESGNETDGVTAGESDGSTDNGSSASSNVAITPDGQIDVDSIEITPNDTVTLDEVSKTWSIVGPNMELTSAKGLGFWVSFYDHNGTIIVLYQVPFGKSNVMGNTDGMNNAYWYDENFNMDSVSGWKMGKTDDQGVTFIAVDGDDSNVN